MTTRHRTLICHALAGVLLASTGLAWAAHEGAENSTESVLFAEQEQEADRDARASAPGSRLARTAASAPRLVTVAADGSTRKVTTEASTVGDVLAAAGVELGPDDRVTPSRDTPVRAGMTVEVARVEVTERTRTEGVDFDTVERPVDGLAAGVHQEKQAGQEGLVEIVERVVLVDDEVESRTRLGARVKREPSDRVVLVGAAESQGGEGSSPSETSSEPEGPALASRQSADGPDPSPTESAATQDAPDQPAPSPAGSAQPAPPEPSPPEPAAQESTGNTQEGEASRYADHFTGDATASGEPYDPNALTAAHRSLPLGTTVTVTNTATGASVRVRINDRGPYAAGRIIDLSRAAWNRIAPPSAGTANVRLEW